MDDNAPSALFWVGLVLGHVYVGFGIWLALRRPAAPSKVADAVTAIVTSLGAGILSSLLAGTIGLDGKVVGEITVAATSGMAVFVLSLVTFYYFMALKPAAARAKASLSRTPLAAKEQSMSQSTVDCRTQGQNCNNDPVTTCTSLDPITAGTKPGNYDLDDHCREFAELLCKAVVRRIENYRLKAVASGTSFPQSLIEWKNWASGRDGLGGLEACIDPNRSGINPTTPQANMDNRQRTSRAITTAVHSLMALDIDDWHGD
jgi:hypothetical protein